MDAYMVFAWVKHWAACAGMQLVLAWAKHWAAFACMPPSFRMWAKACMFVCHDINVNRHTSCLGSAPALLARLSKGVLVPS